MREALDAVLAELGEPASVDVLPYSISRRFENLRVVLADGSARLLRVSIERKSQSGLLHEAAAHEILKSTSLPVVERYTLIPPDVFGAPASLSDWLPGLAGQGVMDAHPDTLLQVCQHLGELRYTLEHETGGAFAMGVVDGRFQPIRTRWSDEYMARAWDWFTRAEAVGASLGPVSRSLMRLLEELAPALDYTERYCLVHGDLRPVNLMMEVGEPPAKDVPPPVTVTGVFDWEFATLADPLLAWALPLELPDEALAHVIQGYGREIVEEWLHDDATMMRLHAYSIGRLFQFLALVVSAQLEGGGMPWGYGMAYASRIARDRLRRGFVGEKLERALETLPEVVSVPQLADPVRAVLRRALGRLEGRPVLGPSVLQAWVGAVGAALRDEAHEAEGWVREGEMLLDALGPGVDHRGFEPIRDRAAWLETMDAHVRGSGVDLAAGVWWLALEGLVQVSESTDPTRWTVPDGVLRGLQSFLEILIATADPQPEPRDQLLHAVMAIACEERIGILLREEPDPDRIAQRRARVLEAWEDLTVFGGETPEELDGSDFADREPGIVAWSVPCVLYATEVVETLPIERRKLVGVLCRGDR